MTAPRFAVIGAVLVASLAVGVHAGERQETPAFGPCFELKPASYVFDGLPLTGYQWVRVAGVPDATCLAW